MRSASRGHNRTPGRASRASGVNEGHYGAQGMQRRAVGYVRVSTDMQAAEGMSLEAQQAAIEGYCAIHGIKLVKLCKDVMSGGKDTRPGLGEALRTLQQSADVLIVLKAVSYTHLLRSAQRNEPAIVALACDALGPLCVPLRFRSGSP